MRNILALERTKSVIVSIAMVVFGVLCIALPTTAYDIMVTILVWSLIALGAILILHYLVNYKFLLSSVNLVNGVILIGLGLLLLYIPGLWVVAIGVALTIAGLQYVGGGLDQKRASEKGWWKDFLYGIIEAAIGIALIVLWYSPVSQSVIMIYLGVSLIADGVFLACAVFFLKKAVKELQE